MLRSVIVGLAVVTTAAAVELNLERPVPGMATRASGYYGCDIVPYSFFNYEAASDSEAIGICEGYLNQGAAAWCGATPNHPGFTLSYRTYGGNPLVPLHSAVSVNWRCVGTVPVYA